MTTLRYVAGFCFAFCTANALAQSGEITFVYGNALVSRAGQEAVVPERGTSLKTDDKIITSKNGLVQIRLASGAKISLRDDSELIIESDRVFLSRGSVHATTQLTNLDQPIKFSVQSRVATIGFRDAQAIVRLSEGDNTATIFTLFGSNVVQGVGDFSALTTTPSTTVQVVAGQKPKIIPTSSEDSAFRARMSK